MCPQWEMMGALAGVRQMLHLKGLVYRGKGRGLD